MLVRHPNSVPTLTDAVWIDLLDATDAEREEVGAATGLRLPGKGDIEEIESSSRVYVDGDALYLSTPMLKGDDCRNMMVAVIEAGMRDGSIRADAGDPKIVSTALWGFMHGVLQLASTKANHLAHDGIATRDLVDHALLMATRSVEAVK